MRRSEFIFDTIDLLYCQLEKISLKRGGSYIDSPKWLKNKKATINPKNENYDNCFLYALTVALNHQNIKNHSEIISKIKPFINQYNWKDIDFPSYPKDWKKFEKKITIIALKLLFLPYNTEKIRIAYKSKYNNERENQVILLMTTDGKK